jgi:hypothetical protein
MIKGAQVVIFMKAEHRHSAFRGHVLEIPCSQGGGAPDKGAAFG